MWVNAVCHHTVSAKRPKINKTNKINYVVKKDYENSYNIEGK